MAKLVVFAALMLLGFAQATTRFTVTTTVDEEGEYVDQWGSQRRCQQQIQQQMQQIRHCQQYMSSSCSQQGGVAADDAADIKIQEVVQQRGGAGQQQQQQHLRQCCMTLQHMPEMCRCEAVRMALRMQQGQMPGGWQGPEMEQMRRVARYLPQQCNMSPQECQV